MKFIEKYWKLSTFDWILERTIKRTGNKSTGEYFEVSLDKTLIKELVNVLDLEEGKLYVQVASNTEYLFDEGLSEFFTVVGDNLYVTSHSSNKNKLSNIESRPLSLKEEIDNYEQFEQTYTVLLKSISATIHEKVKENPTTLTQVEDVLKRKMLGIGDTLTDVQILDLGYPSDKNGISDGNSGRIYALAVDDTYIYSGDDDRTVRKIRKSDMVGLGSSTKSTSSIAALVIDNEYIYSGGGITVRKIRKSDMVEVGNFTGNTSSIAALVIDNEYIYSGGNDKTVRKIRKSDMVEVGSIFTGNTSNIYALASDNEFVYSSGNDKTVRKIRKSDMTEVGSIFTGDTSIVYALASDNEFIYSSGFDNTVRKIRKSDMIEIGKFTGHNNYVRALAVDDTYIYSGGDDRTVRKIRKSDMTEIYRFVGHNYPVNALAIDNEYIYSGGNDRTVRKWFKYMLYKIISI